MIIARELAQNLAMGFRPIRRLAQKRHNTGVQNNPAAAAALFHQLSSAVGRDLTDARVLELGPGQGIGLARVAAPRVQSYAAFDVEPYLDPAQVAALGVDYRVDPSGNLPWNDAAFDVVWSHSVLEHVRDPRATVAEAYRVLRPGGIQVAHIDLQDHYGDRSDPSEMYGFLRYSSRLWLMMTSNRSSYCNRLRASEWAGLATDLGYQVIGATAVPPSCTLDALREVDYLTSVTDEDLMAAILHLVLLRPSP